MLKPGQKFGMLTVISFKYKKGQKGKYKYYYECKCDCGNTVITRGDGLTSGHTRSCGCLQKAAARKLCKTHGMSDTRFHAIWGNMKARCFNKTSFPEAKNYSLRGITLCDKWKNFEGFYDDMYESYIEHINEYGEKDTSIDRIDVNKGYCKDNCKWSTFLEQCNNKTDTHWIEYDDKRMSVADWARELGMPYEALYARIKRKWSIEKAFTTPIQCHKKKG